MKRRHDGEAAAPEVGAQEAAGGEKERIKCPFLDTINRQLLDFDMEALCSVSLTNQNVYACLVCGKYFQGRGKTTHAYTHSVQASHHVFINLETTKIYCLPDGYEVVNSSLDDICKALAPSFSADDVARLDSNTTLARDQYGVAYLPGFVGLNNLGRTDFVNVTLQTLAHIPPLRDFFLDPKNYAQVKSRVVHSFGEVVRKLWSRDNFKSAVSPNEFLQVISVASSRRFTVGHQSECVEFISWLLNTLHTGLCGGSAKKAKSKSSVVHSCFQGKVRVTTYAQQRLRTTSTPAPRVEIGVGGPSLAERQRQAEAMEGASGAAGQWEKDSESVVPFLHLQLDLPQAPLFKDSAGGNIIPQVPLFNVLSKFDGSSATDTVTGGRLLRRTYELVKLPSFVIFHLARFTQNNFFTEKNPTIVTIPVKNLDLKDYLARDLLPALPSVVEISSLSVADLKAFLKEHGVSYQDAVEKSDLQSRALELSSRPLADLMATKYDLVANICHDSPAGQRTEGGKKDPLEGGTYRVHVQNRASEQWYEIQDLHVQETMPQLIGLSESYIMVYSRKSSTST